MPIPDEFRAYYPLSDDERHALWTEGLFVVDTNVLLNLHRFPRQAAEDLLTVLETLGDRLWIPHQVAVEYHRRLAQIFAEQEDEIVRLTREIDGLKERFDKHMNDRQLNDRHTTIDPDTLSATLADATERMRTHLDEAREAVPKLGSEDPVLARVGDLLSGQIGPGPADQGTLDKLYEEATSRLADKRPPGFVDFEQKSKAAAKGDAGADDHGEVTFHNGLRYQSAYGDYVLWRQVLDELGEREVCPPLALVTDDGKEDWWHIQKGRKVGPRVELVHEAQASGAPTFTLLTSSRLLERAQEELGVVLQAESIEQAEKASAVEDTAETQSGAFDSATAARLEAYASGGPVTALVGSGGEALRYLLASKADEEVGRLEASTRDAWDHAHQYLQSGRRDNEALNRLRTSNSEAHELLRSIESGARWLILTPEQRERVFQARSVMLETHGLFSGPEESPHSVR